MPCHPEEWHQLVRTGMPIRRDIVFRHKFRFKEFQESKPMHRCLSCPPPHFRQFGLDPHPPRRPSFCTQSTSESHSGSVPIWSDISCRLKEPQKVALDPSVSHYQRWNPDTCHLPDPERGTNWTPNMNYSKHGSTKHQLPFQSEVTSQNAETTTSPSRTQSMNIWSNNPSSHLIRHSTFRCPWCQCRRTLHHTPAWTTSTQQRRGRGLGITTTVPSTSFPRLQS